MNPSWSLFPPSCELGAIAAGKSRPCRCRDIFADHVRLTSRFVPFVSLFAFDLETRENDVIDASISTMSHGSKHERIAWFKKLKQISRELRLEELNRIFPKQ